MLPKQIVSVSMAFVDMVYLSYKVQPERVRRLVPEHIPLSLVRGNAYVSVVVFRNVAIGIAGRAFLPFVFTQINVRTYAVHPRTGEKGPYFLRCALTSRLLLSGVRLLGYKWEPLKINSATSRSENQERRISVDGVLDGRFFIQVDSRYGDIGDARVTSNGVGDELINLFVGFFPTTSGVGAVPVSHSHQGMREGRVVKMIFPCLSAMGIVNEADVSRPESVTVVDKAHFIVYFPSEPVTNP